MTIRTATMAAATPAIQRTVPTTGNTVALSASATTDIVGVMEPAGTLATLIVTLPVASFDGQRVTILTTALLTVLTVNSAAGSVVSAITTLIANDCATYLWSASQTKWYRCA